MNPLQDRHSPRFIESLKKRWTAERRARLVSALPTDEWRALAVWEPRGDARPDLRGIDLRSLPLRGIDFSDTRLDYACLDMADLRNASLARASLEQASLKQAILLDINAFAANLYAADLDQAIMIRACLAAANLGSSSLRRTILRDANLRGASFHEAALLGCRLEGAATDGADFEDAILVGCRGLYQTSARNDSQFQPLRARYGQLMASLDVRSQLIADGCLAACEGPHDVRALLLADNWRDALAGVAACIILGPSEMTNDLLWLRLRQGSWIAPQLAAAARFLDPDFNQNSRAFLATDRQTLDHLVCPEAYRYPPPKSLFSVHALAGGVGLPAQVHPHSPLAYAGEVAQRWHSRTEQALLPIYRRRIESGLRELAARRARN